MQTGAIQPDDWMQHNVSCTATAFSTTLDIIVRLEIGLKFENCL